MQNFLRALKQAGQYWRSLVLATVCSFAVAALWGANIGAFLPILQVAIQGKSLQQHISDQASAAERAVADLDHQIADQDGLQAEHGVGVESTPNKTSLRSKRDGQAAKLLGLRKIEPWVQRFVPTDAFQTIAWIVAILVVSTLVKHVFLMCNEVLVGRVALDISRNLRVEFFDKALHMDRAGFSKIGTAGITSQITHTSEMLSLGLMNALGAAIREPLKVIACLVGAGLICWRLLLLSVVIAPLVGWMLVTVTRRIKGISRGILKKATSFHETIQESLGNIQTVQAYRTEERELLRFGETTRMMKNFGLKYIFYSALTKPIIEFLGLGMLGTTIAGGAYLVLNQETHILGIRLCNEPLSVESLLVFFGMLIGVSDPLRKLSSVYSTIYAGTVAADSLYAVLDRKNEIQDAPSPARPGTPHKVLSIKQVDFGYQADQTILSDVSLEVPYGSTIAVVGPNGSGKSTLINLLCRFYDPQSGALCFDGIDFRDMQIADVRKRIALVNQQTELFNETVAYNIRYGRPDASDEEVVQVAKQAHAHEFIVGSLESGYETVVGHNGQRLSGGQRQRIALARALLCKPEILILDEATSQIDMDSEQLIRESLAEHRGESTFIIITHREKLLELAERVFEVKDGRLVETTGSSDCKAA